MNYPTASTIRSRGFSLMELMIAVAVIAILAAIALPSYQSYIRNGRRGDVTAFMMDVAARQQQYLMDNRAYASGTYAVAGATLHAAAPSSLTGFYTFAFNPATTDTTFTLVATAQDGQTADSEVGTSCTVLTLDQSGTKTPAACWKQ